MRDTLRLSLSFQPRPRRVEHMRRITGTLLQQCGVHEEAVATVQLLVSEIVTNAVLHGHGPRVRFSLSCDRSGDVLIEVDDYARGRVEVRRPGPEEENGRGMFLVASLARDWGRRGTCTWCTVSTAAAASAS
ncbi:ATP-binding protein [Streptomyces sp. NPDC006923]|uniref:ATP-binding protein n=1 Tax=Streptomyces sp. NPDC006923 TaxID=3155355 RepID=UPI0033C6F642